MRSFQRFLVLLAVIVFPVAASAQGLDTAKIDAALGRSGQKIGDVYKFGFPRTDLHVSVHGLAIKPGLALGSWAAFTGTDADAMVMGDLVLLEDEINPVMDKLRSSGFEISAVHNHLIDETPHVMYMHYMGGVLSYGVPRADSITMAGTTLAPAAGVAEAINFQSANSGNVATTGDFVLTAEEVNSVISELQAHHILVTALHSHMLTEQPRLFFMHFWGQGPAQDVAAGMKAALDKVHTK
jgi:hypothetical protein